MRNVIHKTVKFFKEHESQFYMFSICILLITAVLLGFAIYRQRHLASLLKQGVPRPSSVVVSPEPRSALQEEDVLKFPGPDASAEEKMRHFDIARSLAKDGQYVDIGNCTASPTVFRVREKDAFTVRNQDTIAHTIILDQEHQYTIGISSKKTLIADFPHGQGLYGYGCDNPTQTVGLFFVVP